MFTGLVADRGAVLAVARERSGVRLHIGTALAAEISEGGSVAVNGVCLTATAVTGEGFSADVMRETLDRSTLGELEAGAPVNIELPLRADGRLGGHIVQGHVDATATVTGSREEGFARVLTLAVPPGTARYLVPKGSVALDGVSLTVSTVSGSALSVSLIPETLARTTLGEAGIGDRVNLEVDVLAKHV
ncbi:MAG: riboflavin synthase, partial [Acidobacteriota bacterium]|nr:riboflavin synthase [Acidobacteriota bacterium]